MAGGLPGQQIGRYRILDELGRGAMGVVYRAEDPTIGRVVALKTMRVDLEGSHNDEILRRFRLEARSAGVLNHPNIVTIYDAGEQGGLFYMAMEFIQGNTLQSLLDQQGILPTHLVIEIGKQICTGLDYAHAHDVIHRDIKPANIMITPEGTVKIMDFGIAKTGAGMTTVGQVLGTPSYMSPEQVKGQQLDGRSDLFSVGVILYEAVTGVKPFAADNITAIVYKIVHEELTPPANVEMKVHPGLSTVITRALAKSPAERYQRGAELAKDLLNYQLMPVEESVPVVSPEAETMALRLPPGAAARDSAVAPASAALPAARPGAPSKSGKSLAAVAVVLTVVLLGGGALLWMRHKKNQSLATAPAATQPAPASSSTPTPAVASTEAPPPAPSPEPVVPQPTTATEPAPDATSADSVPGTAAPAPAADAARPQSAKPAATTGDLKVSTSPDGVSVQVDGRSDPRWNTPYTIAKLSPGQHRVTFNKPGYASEARTAQITAGRTLQLYALLSPLAATLSVGSTPAGADILVDGKETGKTTPAQVLVDQGAHTILLRKSGFQPAETTVKLQPGESHSFAPALTPVVKETPVAESPVTDKPAEKPKDKPGNIFKRIFGGDDRETLDVRTKPVGAEVLIDGALLPRKTPTRTPLKPGTHRVTIRMEGYRTLEKTIELKKGAPLQIDEALERQ